jgi:hypothetical protein
MCDDDIRWNTIRSFAHDHDYTIMQDHDSSGVILNKIVDDNLTIDDNIETNLTIDQSFGILHFEVIYRNMCFCGNQRIFIEQKLIHE